MRSLFFVIKNFSKISFLSKLDIIFRMILIAFMVTVESLMVYGFINNQFTIWNLIGSLPALILVLWSNYLSILLICEEIDKEDDLDEESD